MQLYSQISLIDYFPSDAYVISLRAPKELFNDSYKCQFTSSSIILINNSKKNIIAKLTDENLNIKNNNQNEEAQEEEAQEEEAQEENPIPLNPPSE